MLDTTGDLNNSLLIQDILQIFSDRLQVVDGRKDIINIYKYDSNKFTMQWVTDLLSKVSIPVFREMGLYLRYKKAVYKKRDTDI
jgi:hypothetical protein